MKIEVWSDVVCPFCYIGKVRLENALKEIDPKLVDLIEWKSFQLDPNAEMHAGKPLNQYLSESKGISMEEAAKLSDYVSEKGLEDDIHFQFDKAIVANTKKAHLLLHLAKDSGNQNRLKERLMRAYFLEGKDLNREEVLLELAEEVGLDAAKSKEALQSEELAYDFKSDIQEAGQLGVRGVPFFVFNRKFAVSGAQPMETFRGAVQKAMKESNIEIVNQQDGDACSVDDPNC
ncbi:MAG: DsbA family oxidoreductase [Bacteroidetes bacterium]|nr:MAG: DsbA family oxidoreductase [Bacteroidota bacterium]